MLLQDRGAEPVRVGQRFDPLFRLSVDVERSGNKADVPNLAPIVGQWTAAEKAEGRIAPLIGQPVA